MAAPCPARGAEPGPRTQEGGYGRRGAVWAACRASDKPDCRHRGEPPPAGQASATPHSPWEQSRPPTRARYPLAACSLLPKSKTQPVPHLPPPPPASPRGASPLLHPRRGRALVWTRGAGGRGGQRWGVPRGSRCSARGSPFSQGWAGAERGRPPPHVSVPSPPAPCVRPPPATSARPLPARCPPLKPPAGLPRPARAPPRPGAAGAFPPARCRPPPRPRPWPAGGRVARPRLGVKMIKGRGQGRSAAPV